MELYRHVLKAQPDNIYAANGLGTCLAELGHLAAAKVHAVLCTHACHCRRTPVAWHVATRLATRLAAAPHHSVCRPVPARPVPEGSAAASSRRACLSCHACRSSRPCPLRQAVFDDVLRASSKAGGFVKLPEAFVNAGNVWLARQAYGDAVKMYEHASKLHNHKNPQVRARALAALRALAAHRPRSVSPAGAPPVMASRTLLRAARGPASAHAAAASSSQIGRAHV